AALPPPVRPRPRSCATRAAKSVAPACSSEQASWPHRAGATGTRCTRTLNNHLIAFADTVANFRMDAITDTDLHVTQHRLAILQHFHLPLVASAFLQRRDWHQYHILCRLLDKEHLRGHVGHQAAIRVVDIKQCSKQHHVVEHLWRWQYLPQAAVPALFSIANRREVHRHAEA